MILRPVNNKWRRPRLYGLDLQIRPRLATAVLVDRLAQIRSLVPLAQSLHKQIPVLKNQKVHRLRPTLARLGPVDDRLRLAYRIALDRDRFRLDADR